MNILPGIQISHKSVFTLTSRDPAPQPNPTSEKNSKEQTFFKVTLF